MVDDIDKYGSVPPLLALANFPSFLVPPKGIYVLFHSIFIWIFCFANFFDIGKYYLVDSGYPNRQGYLAPFKGSTYHILEFRLRNGRPPQGKYEIFNFLHSSLRNVIERAFGVLKQKWRILKGIPSFFYTYTETYNNSLHGVA